jgi:hypothetical protein
MTLLRNGKHREPGLKSQSLSRTETRACFVGCNVGVGHEMDVCGHDLSGAIIHNNTAVHLGEFGEALGREICILQQETACAHFIDDGTRADQNKSTCSLTHDDFGSGTQRRARGESSKKFDR